MSKTSELRNKHRSSSSSSYKGDDTKSRNASSSSEVSVFTDNRLHSNSSSSQKDEEDKSHHTDSSSEVTAFTNNVDKSRDKYMTSSNDKENDIAEMKPWKSRSLRVGDNKTTVKHVTLMRKNSEPLHIEKSKINGVIDPPRILQSLPDHMEITMDQPFCLECRFNFLNQKSTVAWFKDGIELPKVGRIKWSVDKAFTKLWINRASKGDVGNYRVLIRNGGGEASSRCQVKFKSLTTSSRALLQPQQGQY